jgi:hypothetical protein
LKQRPKGGGWQLVFPPQVAGNPGLGIRQRVQELIKRAGLEWENQAHSQPVKDHAQRACEDHLNSHVVTSPRGQMAYPAWSGGPPPWASLYRG